MKELILKELNAAASTLQLFIENHDQIEAVERAATIMIESLKNGGKIIACGNGGSMSDAMHFCAELTGNFERRRVALPALPLSDVAHLSCVANDFGYENVFGRAILAHAKPVDTVLLISTSGTSINIQHAAIASFHDVNSKTILLTGPLPPQSILDNCDVVIRVEDTIQTKHIQEMHIKILHILVMLIEKGLGV